MKRVADLSGPGGAFPDATSTGHRGIIIYLNNRHNKLRL